MVCVFTIVKDLVIPNAVNELFREVKALGLDVDYLVNNAGFGDHGAFVDTQWERYEEMIALNVKVLTHLSHLYTRDWIGRKKGKIVNISSTAAFQPGPMMTVYFATKAYVYTFRSTKSGVKKRGHYRYNTRANPLEDSGMRRVGKNEGGPPERWLNWDLKP